MALTKHTVSLDAISFVGEDLIRPECVLATEAGTLFVSDKRGGVTCLRPGRSQRLIGGSTIVSNGIALLPNGDFLIANLSDDGGVWRLSSDGTVRPEITEIEARPLGSVNFVRTDARGRLWICVSTVRKGDDQYRTDVADGFIALRDDRGCRIVADQLIWTNECQIDASGEHLYVNETFGRRLTRFRLHESGKLDQRATVTEFGHGTYPDGLGLDEEGCFWVVSVGSNRVIRVSPDGEQHVVIEDSDADHIEHLERALAEHRLTRPMLYENRSAKLQNITSIAFGGPDRRTAYLGSLRGTSLATFRSPVAGARPVHWEWGGALA